LSGCFNSQTTWTKAAIFFHLPSKTPGNDDPMKVILGLEDANDHHELEDHEVTRPTTEFQMNSWQDI